MENVFLNFTKKIRNKKLLETEYQFQKNKTECIHLFKTNFHEICKNIVEIQKKGNLSEISYLEYTMLYTNFIRRNYIVEVRAYNENWFLDKQQEIIGTFDVSFLFEKYTELWEQLLSEKNRYVGKVRSREITKIMLSALPDFFSYVTAICRFGILSCVEDGCFSLIKKGEAFEVNVGEYMSKTEAIYKENKQKDLESIKEWFQERKEYEYAFEDFSGLDFSELDLSEMDLRYSDFRNTNLKHTDFKDAMLFGTRFCNADMKGADLRYSMLYEADFTGADLQEAKFQWVEANEGMQDEEEWQTVGYMGVCFKKANLQHADFTKAKLMGADFTEAKMDGAIFLREQINQFHLSEEQKAVIQVK